jgi:hypothetical protein
VFPGEPNGRLLLWFQGGGACDSYESCFRPDLVTATPSVVPNAGGLFDVRRGEVNPAVAGGWTMVVVNYCSADVHVGNAVHNFSSASGEPTRAAVYAGVNHTRAVLSWIDEQDFGDGETRRVAGGCSAGSIGVQLWAPALIADFDFSDGILMDSYVGIMPPAADVFWNLINVCEVSYPPRTHHNPFSPFRSSSYRSDAYRIQRGDLYNEYLPLHWLHFQVRHLRPTLIQLYPATQRRLALKSPARHRERNG